MHALDGYVNEDHQWLELEQDMGFAAELGGCPVTTSSGHSLVYSLQLDVMQDTQTVRQETIATDLLDGHEVLLPAWIVTDAPAMLEWRVFRTECKIIGVGPGAFESCKPAVQLEDHLQAFVVRPLGHFSYVAYDKPSVGVADDGIAGNFEPVVPLTITTSTELTGLAVTFGAEGYAVQDGVSTRPAVASIGLGTAFAVYEDDFFVQTIDDPVAQMEASGQDRPAGLRWAHVSGSRNGHPFQYSTALPKLVHDRVAKCPETLGFTEPVGPPRDDGKEPTWPPSAPFDVTDVGDSFYKIPFAAGFEPGTGGNFNIDDPNADQRHGTNQAYCVDFGADLNISIVAARGGVVADFQDNDSWNYFDPNRPADWPYDGNYLFIQHEDDTYAVYFHMPYKGVFVAKGQRVHRGDTVAVVGMTGRSSGPHVHFGVSTAESPDWNQVRIRYSAVVDGPNEVGIDGCYIPRSTDTFSSTNG
jgi:hypothetical protein